jgi:flagellar motor switch protein FliM
VAGDVITLRARLEDSVEMKVAGIPSFQAQLMQFGGHRAVKLLSRAEESRLEVVKR